MSTQTSIEWTEMTWNPIVGCTKVSPGCKHCYAENMAYRLQAMGTPGYENGFRLSLRPEKLQEPLQRKKPTIYFVNSMSDLFHEHVPDEYIDQVFEVIQKASQHTFQILTKRAERLAEYFSKRTPPANAWLTNYTMADELRVKQALDIAVATGDLLAVDKNGKTRRRKGTSIKSTDILIAPPQRPIFFVPPLKKSSSEN